MYRFGTPGSTNAEFIQLSPRQRKHAFATYFYMFRAIGFVIVLWYISQLFGQSIAALDNAGKATFETLEAAAIVSRSSLK